MDRVTRSLLYDNIHDFKNTAIWVESEIKRHGIRHDSLDAVPDMQSRIHTDMWMSMKTVSHFNLGTSLELMLKFILYLNNVSLKTISRNRRHALTALYDAMPLKAQESLESAYHEIGGIKDELIAFINVPTLDDKPIPPPSRSLSSLRDFFVYFDEDMRLWEKRYSFELIDKGQYRHYLSNIARFVKLINLVMRDIPRDEITRASDPHPS